ASLADSFLADLDELSDNEVQLVTYCDMGSYFPSTLSIRMMRILMQLLWKKMMKVTCRILKLSIMMNLIAFQNCKRQRYNDIMQVRVILQMLLISLFFGLTIVNSIIMVVSVTASTTSGQPLSEGNLQKTIDACDRALSLDLAKKKVLDFVESRMGYIAPNLSVIVGSAVAAKIMGTAGGLLALAKMLACNVQLLGAKKKTLVGFSTATSQFCIIFRMISLTTSLFYYVFIYLLFGDGLGEGYGMLGQAGSGKLRVSIGQSKLAVKAAKRSATSSFGHVSSSKLT
ncbi:hypothetical protein B296_00023598, partial [Ensete ventricosum]